MNKQVSFDNEPLILVDADGTPIGSKSKLECHLGQGILHKAFSVFVFNSQQEVLLQKRSAEKMLWPSYWSNSCCSHPRLHEKNEIVAAERRIAEELGFAVTDLTRHFDFEYQATYKDVGSEWERCSVFTALSDTQPRVNPREIEDTRWVPMDELAEILLSERDSFTPWIKLEWQRLLPMLKAAAHP